MARKSAPKPAAAPVIIPPEMRKALADRRVSADSEALLADLIDVWGGTRRLALDLHHEFQGAQRGGMTRQRILEMIQRLIITNTTHDIGRSIAPSDLPTDELERLACHYAGKVIADGPAPAAD